MGPKILRSSFWYWNRLSGEAGQRVGTVVVLGWMLSRPRNLAPYIRFYESCGWDSLICHPQVLNIFFPRNSGLLSLSLLDELAKDLEGHLRPVMIAIFSGGDKACFFKIVQILQGKCSDLDLEQGKFDSIRRCLVGLIFDSSPVEFSIELGIRFIDQQILTCTPGRPNATLSRGTHAFGRTLGFLFHSRFELERINLWHTLYSIVNIGPILFLCSDNDELAPAETILKYACNLRELGGNVTLLSWKISEHVGHFRLYPEEYKNAVKKSFNTAASLFSERVPAQNGELFMDKDTTGSSENRVQVRVLEPFSDGFTSSWAVLPEGTVLRIQEISKLPHFTNDKKGKGSMHHHFSDERNSEQGSESGFFSSYQEVDDWEFCSSEQFGSIRSDSVFGSIKSQPSELSDKMALKSRL